MTAQVVSWPEVLGALVSGTDLTADQTGWAMGELLAGEATPAQIAGFAVALRAKGETIEEVRGLADAMLARATPIEVPGRLLDVVGTGGDRSMSVNISTMAAIVAAGAGARVAKHGNRSASSQSGSADVLEALGIRLDLPPGRVAEVGVEAGITFCFSAAFHPAMRHAAVPRRELGIATTFNLLGPLTNPTRPGAQAIGCADQRMAPVMAGVYAGRGVDAWVFRGDDGLDELTTTTTSTVWVVHAGSVTQTTVDPRELGLAEATTEDLRGGDAQHNADVVRRVLAGEPGPVRDAVLLNAGAALAVHGAPGEPVQQALAEGYARAAEAVDSGAAARRDARPLGRRAPLAGTRAARAAVSRLQRVALPLAVEAEPVVVGPDHLVRGDHPPEAALAQHPAAAPDELARGEVAVSRGDVVELYPGHVAVGAEQDDPDRLVPLDHDERVPVRPRTPVEVGLEPADVVGMAGEHVAQVVVLGADLDHLEGLVVVPLPDQADDEEDVDAGHDGVHADHRPDPDQGVERQQDQAGHQVERRGTAAPGPAGGSRPAACCHPIRGGRASGRSARSRAEATGDPAARPDRHFLAVNFRHPLARSASPLESRDTTRHCQRPLSSGYVGA